MVLPHSAARYRQIAEVLVGNGLFALAEQVGLAEHVPAPMRRGLLASLGAAAEDREDALPGPVRLRTALEELGPTFVKLGQMLATRDDLLPAEYTEELTRLQDGVTPVPYEEIAALVREELGAAADEAFAAFDHTPLATASIGQAHGARLREGTEVVVKVRKPGVQESVITDLDILRHLAGIADREWDLARDVDIVGLVEAFDRSLRRELDYRTEAANVERFRENLAGDPVVRIPRVYAEASTSQVLTEERARGLRITDGPALDGAGIDRPALARAATRTIVQMVLVDGIFHADPHPGNMFVREDGGLWLIDYGMIGELRPSEREDIVRLTFALSRHDRDGVAAALLRLAPPRGSLDRPRYHRDVQALLETVEGRALGDISLEQFFSRLTVLIRRHRLQLPSEISMLLRMLVLVEASAIALDPAFRITDVLQEVLPVALAQLWSPEAILHRVSSAGLDALHLGAEAPRRAQRLLDDYEARGVAVRMDASDLEPLIERVEATGDRVVASITMGALLVGIGRVAAASASGRPRGLRDPLLLAAGGATALLGTYLAAGAGPARTIGRVIRRSARGR
ncbi:AarF/ABC1/UbiB kinase family protein [Brachybacterium sp. YJGR34]|uniref:ABC1 kinase family protein n=1 Tax=Brachybacterium sp. YJGR34 TaxID=2059911 RepID=UPI000E0B7B82|nr:AarF/UbiB family protein [Brachybacterium sp. YJGR34]